MNTVLIRRLAIFVFVLISAFLVGSSSVSAHPLGNFTTNTASRIVVKSNSVELLYVVDMAEIPTLKVRQSLNASTGDVPAAVATKFREATCITLGKSLSISVDSAMIPIHSTGSSVKFPEGQAGLTTLRLECSFDAAIRATLAVTARIRFTDANFADRLGWREISVISEELEVSGDIVSTSPSKLLTSYPSGSVSSPLHQKAVAFSVQRGSSRAAGSLGVVEPSQSGREVDRGNDGLTERFQSLVARREVSLPFAIVAMLVAMVLGGLHALAPGHGKTIMAAYAVSRRGRRGDIVSIGMTVALTHTIGILILGTIISATSVVSSEGALKWASVVSGVLVTSVGVSLLRTRLSHLRSNPRLRSNPHGKRADHNQHDHGPDHGHSHDHDHPHDHDHGHALESDSRFIVTSHAHGGWQHNHVLPAPGALVRRRELIAMGLAGGMVPSPSALVVLLAAIALGRIPFGLALVAAYGVGLALTLVAAGLLLVRFERSIRGWGARRSTPVGIGVTRVVEALPLVSGSAIIGAGLLLVIRSLALI